MVRSTRMVSWPFTSELDSLLSACGMATWGAYRTFNESVRVLLGWRSRVGVRESVLRL